MGTGLYGMTISFFGLTAKRKHAVLHKQGFAMRSFGMGAQKTVQVCFQILLQMCELCPAEQKAEGWWG